MYYIIHIRSWPLKDKRGGFMSSAGDSKQTALEYDTRVVVTQQTVPEKTEEFEIRENIAKTIARTIEPLMGQEKRAGGIATQNNFNIGMIGYSVLEEGDEKPKNKLLVALSGENDVDQIAEVIDRSLSRSNKERKAEWGGTFGEISLVSSTQGTAAFYGYGAVRKIFAIKEEKKDEEPPRNPTFLYIRVPLRLYSYVKQKEGLQKQYLKLLPAQQKILSDYLDMPNPASLKALQDMIVAHPGNDSLYKCSEPKLNAERRKLLLFSHGFRDTGENHFAISYQGKDKAAPEPKHQFSCGECQSRGGKHRHSPVLTAESKEPSFVVKSIKPAPAGKISPLRIHSLAIQAADKSAKDKSKEGKEKQPSLDQEIKSLGEQIAQIDRLATKIGLKTKKAILHMQRALQRCKEKGVSLEAARDWAQAMYLNVDVGTDKNFSGQADVLNELASVWFRGEGDYHFDSAVMGYVQDYHNAIPLYDEAILRMEEAIPKMRGEPTVIAEKKKESANYYMKRGISRLQVLHYYSSRPDSREVKNPEEEAKERLGDIQASIADYHAAYRLDPDVKSIYPDSKRLYIDAFRRQGDTFYQHRDYKGTVECYTQAIRLDPDNPDCYVYRAIAKYLLHVASGESDHHEIIDDFRTAEKLKNGRSLAFIDAAEELEEGPYEKLKQLLESAQKIQEGEKLSGDDTSQERKASQSMPDDSVPKAAEEKTGKVLEGDDEQEKERDLPGELSGSHPPPQKSGVGVLGGGPLSSDSVGQERELFQVPRGDSISKVDEEKKGKALEGDDEHGEENKKKGGHAGHFIPVSRLLYAGAGDSETSSEAFAGLVKGAKAEDINFKHSSHNDKTALHIAIENKQYDKAKILLNSGANPGIKDAQGKAPKDVLLGLLKGKSQKSSKEKEIMSLLTAKYKEFNPKQTPSPAAS